MINPERLLGQILGGNLGGSFGGKRRRGSKSGGLLGGVSGTTKAQIGIGLLGVAYAAYQHYAKKDALPPQPGQAASTALPPPPPLPSGIATPPPPPAAALPDQRSRDMTLLVQAMVAAAAADGLIDDSERATILGRARESGLDGDTVRFLEQEIQNPKSLASIVSASRPEIAREIYAASCVAISLDTDAERAYLATLGERLGVPQSARDEIHTQLGFA